MLKFSFAVAVLMISTLFANDGYIKDINDNENSETSAKPLFISLGSYCEMALRLRDCGVRHAAFPFDWTITKSHDHFISLFTDDFQFFTKEEFFCQLEDYPMRVQNTYYKIFFIHDWPFPDSWNDASRYAEQLHAIKIKYDKRISRFKQLKHYSGTVFFFRTFWFEEGNHVNAQQAQEIKMALDHYFPNLKFTLVIVNYTDSNSPVIEGFNNILEFKIRREQNLQDFQAMINTLLYVSQ